MIASRQCAAIGRVIGSWATTRGAGGAAPASPARLAQPYTPRRCVRRVARAAWAGMAQRRGGSGCVRPPHPSLHRPGACCPPHATHPHGRARPREACLRPGLRRAARRAGGGAGVARGGAQEQQRHSGGRKGPAHKCQNGRVSGVARELGEIATGMKKRSHPPRRRQLHSLRSGAACSRCGPRRQAVAATKRRRACLLWRRQTWLSLSRPCQRCAGAPSESTSTARWGVCTHAAPRRACWRRMRRWLARLRAIIDDAHLSRSCAHVQQRAAAPPLLREASPAALVWRAACRAARL
jgi:hypothetical protein